MTSAYFQGELKFVPRYRYINRSDCVKKKISFQDDQVKLEVGENDYKEWMMTCRPAQFYASFQAEYYLSRVYNSDSEVFVYRRKKDSDKVVLENRFGNVRFKI